MFFFVLFQVPIKYWWNRWAVYRFVHVCTYMCKKWSTVLCLLYNYNTCEEIFTKLYMLLFLTAYVCVPCNNQTSAARFRVFKGVARLLDAVILNSYSINHVSPSFPTSLHRFWCNFTYLYLLSLGKAHINNQTLAPKSRSYMKPKHNRVASL